MHLFLEFLSVCESSSGSEVRNEIKAPSRETAGGNGCGPAAHSTEVWAGAEEHVLTLLVWLWGFQSPLCAESAPNSRGCVLPSLHCSLTNELEVWVCSLLHHVDPEGTPSSALC